MSRIVSTASKSFSVHEVIVSFPIDEEYVLDMGGNCTSVRRFWCGLCLERGKDGDIEIDLTFQNVDQMTTP